MIASTSLESKTFHCKNLDRDRSIGQYWEREFCKMAASFGKSFTPLQIGRETSTVAYIKTNGLWNHYTLPDVTVWTSPSEHHEIKHKNPTRGGLFGLEVYRFNALLWFANESKQTVMYTIHNHDLAGGTDGKINDIGHWFTVNVLDLNNKWSNTWCGESWVNGVKKKNVPTHYWHKSLWLPLFNYWTEAKA